MRTYTPSGTGRSLHTRVRVRSVWNDGVPQWGTFEWDGDWSDNSAKWTEDLKRACRFEKKDDGSFWMCWADFVKNFSRVGAHNTRCAVWP